MEIPLLFKHSKFGGIYINKEGLCQMLTLEERMGDNVWPWFVELVSACSIERSFVEDITFRGRPIITPYDIGRAISFYQALRQRR